MLRHLKLGEVLAQHKLISENELQPILKDQPNSSKRIGELLVERSIISPDDLNNALKEQYWRDCGYWVIG